MVFIIDFKSVVVLDRGSLGFANPFLVFIIDNLHSLVFGNLQNILPSLTHQQ